MALENRKRGINTNTKMAHIRVSSSPPVIQTVVQTVQGECAVKIALEINVNLNGSVQASVSEAAEITDLIQEKEQSWAIPDFEDTEPFTFGKEEKI